MSFNSQDYLNDQSNKQYGEMPLYHKYAEIDVTIDDEVMQEMITSDSAII